MPRFVKHALLFLLCLLAASCIDCKEEYWIDGDGSGRAALEYNVPDAFLAAKGDAGLRDSVKAWMSDHKALNLEAFEITHANDRATVKARVTFKSALDLASLATDGSLDNLSPTTKSLIGQLDIRAQGRNIDLSRTIHPGDVLGGGTLIPNSEINGRHMVYTVHLPVAATDSNATRTEDDGKTLIWNIPLAECMTAPIITRFHATMPVPRKWIFAGIGSCALLVLLIVRRLPFRRSSSSGSL